MQGFHSPRRPLALVAALALAGCGRGEVSVPRNSGEVRQESAKPAGAAERGARQGAGDVRPAP